MKKLLLIIVLSAGFCRGANQNFQTGSIQLNSDNQYITGKQLYLVQKILYAKSDIQLQSIVSNINDKEQEIENSNIIYYKKKRITDFLDELNAIVSDVLKNKQVDMEETLSDVMKD